MGKSGRKGYLDARDWGESSKSVQKGHAPSLKRITRRIDSKHQQSLTILKRVPRDGVIEMVLEVSDQRSCRVGLFFSSPALLFRSPFVVRFFALGAARPKRALALAGCGHRPAVCLLSVLCRMSVEQLHGSVANLLVHCSYGPPFPPFHAPFCSGTGVINSPFSTAERRLSSTRSSISFCVS